MKAKVKLVSYSEEQVDIGSIRLTVLKPAGEKHFEEPVELGDKPEEELERIAMEAGEGSYVEAIAEIKNQIIRVGVPKTLSSSMPGRQSIFYRPSRLLRIGVISGIGQNGQNKDLIEGFIKASPSEAEDKAEVEGEGSLGSDHDTQAREVGEVSNIEWYYPQGEFYVFEGDLRISGSCEAVVVVTEHGEKIHFLRASSEEKAIIARRARASKKRRKRRKKAKGS